LASEIRTLLGLGLDFTAVEVAIAVDDAVGEALVIELGLGDKRGLLLPKVVTVTERCRCRLVDGLESNLLEAALAETIILLEAGLAEAVAVLEPCLVEARSILPPPINRNYSK